MRYATHLIQRTATSSDPTMTRFEAWTGMPPVLETLRVFGCDAYVHNPDRGKFESKTLACIYLGPADVNVKKAHRLCLKPNQHKVVFSENVTFDEYNGATSPPSSLTSCIPGVSAAPSASPSLTSRFPDVSADVASPCDSTFCFPDGRAEVVPTPVEVPTVIVSIPNDPVDVDPIEPVAHSFDVVDAREEVPVVELELSPSPEPESEDEREVDAVLAPDPIPPRPTLRSFRIPIPSEKMA